MNQNNDENYVKYRGKCKEYCLQLIEKDSTLTLVKGYYHCVVWGKQSHWWCVNTDGKIIDPTILQFPSGAATLKLSGEALENVYEEFNPNIQCDNCGRGIHYDSALIAENGYYAFCSHYCYMRFVGL